MVTRAQVREGKTAVIMIENATRDKLQSLSKNMKDTYNDVILRLIEHFEKTKDK